jgi:glucose-1-phosphate adenylyltransferase
LIANGCFIEGIVENSIISRRVHVKKGAVIKNCIIMQNCTIEEEAKLTNIITDKNVCIGKGKKLKGDKEIPLVIEKEPML